MGLVITVPQNPSEEDPVSKVIRVDHISEAYRDQQGNVILQFTNGKQDVFANPEPDLLGRIWEAMLEE